MLSLQILPDVSVRPRKVAALVAALTLVALGLRLVCVRQSLFGDELFLYVDVHGRSLGQVFSAVHDTEKTPPLGFVLGWLFTRGSPAPELVRVPSLVASVATVPLIYLLGVRVVGSGAALVATAWFALSPFEIFYGSEARSYAQVAALLVTSTLSLLLALDERRTRWWALYAVAATAAVYTHYIAALTLVPQAAWALWRHRDSLRKQLIANGVVVLAFLPWVPSFVVQVRHSADEARRLAELAPLTVSNVFEAAGQALVGHPFLALQELPGSAPLWILALLLALALLVAILKPRRGDPPTLSASGGLVLLLAGAPLVGLVLYSLRPDTSFLLARNLAGAVPYALLLLGWLLTRPGRRLGAASSLAALALVAVGTVKTLDPDNQRTDARDAARYIDAKAPPAAPVVDVQDPYRGPPAQGTQIYLERLHRIYEDAEWLAAWRAARRARSPIFLSAPRVPALLRVFRPPRRHAGGYRLVAEHTSRGLRPILTREYAPR